MWFILMENIVTFAGLLKVSPPLLPMHTITRAHTYYVSLCIQALVRTLARSLTGSVTIVC